MFRRWMALVTETPDAELDVIGGGFWTVPAFGLQCLSYGLGTRRKWKLKDTPVTCGDAFLLVSPRPFEIVAAFFPGKNDVPHPGPQRCRIRRSQRHITSVEARHQCERVDNARCCGPDCGGQSSCGAATLECSCTVLTGICAPCAGKGPPVAREVRLQRG